MFASGRRQVGGTGAKPRPDDEDQLKGARRCLYQETEVRAALRR